MTRTVGGICLTLAALGFWLLADRYAGACGMAWHGSAPIEVAEESAIIVWDEANQTEHFIRRASFKTAAKDFGFLVPTPTRPELAEAKDLAFQYLEGLTAAPDRMVPPGGPGRPNVTVLEKKRVAGYDAAVLKADDATALNDWLKNNGYQSRSELVSWLETYVKAGWIITAFKIASKDAPQTKEINTSAVRMSFKTDRPFYPYREPADQRTVKQLGQGNPVSGAGRLLRIYVLAKDRVQAKLGDKAWPGTTVWSRTVTKDACTALAKHLQLDHWQANGTWWLTELEDRSSPRPGTDELYFTTSIDQSAVEKDDPYRYAVPKENLATLVEGNNQFALDLYGQLVQTPGNKFFSPYSISTALGMTYAGARGETAKEMAGALHFTLEKEQLHPTFGALIRQILAPNKPRDFQLTTANSLWGHATAFHINADFLRSTQTDYRAGFHLVDFSTDGARNQINGWVAEKTNDRITNLLPLGALTPRTRIVLVNAIYFKGSWLEQFAKNATRPEEFTIPGTPAVKVPTMHNTLMLNHLATDDFQLAQLPYVDNEISMVIILPKKKDGLAEVEKKLSPKMLQQALAQAKFTNVYVSLPKFKMTEEFNLNANLSALGMKKAFQPGIADLTGMEERVRQEDPLFISKVIHKAFVDVDEEGTEAAAATAVVGSIIVSLPVPPPPPIPFNADHPFLFMVRHNATGSILFMGRVDDPRGK